MSDMKLHEWKQLCRKAWVNEYDYLQKDSFAKIRDTLLEIVKKELINDAPLKRHLFDFITVKCCLQLKTETI